MTDFRTVEQTPLHLRPSFTTDVIGLIEESGGSVLTALATQLAINKIRKSETIDAADTTFSDTLDRTMSIAKRIGFVELGSVELDCRPGNKMYVLQHNESKMVLVITTYNRGKISVNDAVLYFAIKPTQAQMQDLWLSGAGGAWQSVSNPNWNLDPKHVRDDMKEINYPQDALYVGKIHAVECLASKHKMLQECNPHPYPVMEYCDVFQEALTENADYDFRGLKSFNFKHNEKVLLEVASTRASAMGISPALFGRRV